MEETIKDLENEIMKQPDGRKLLCRLRLRLCEEYNIELERMKTREELKEDILRIEKEFELNNFKEGLLNILKHHYHS